MEITAYVLLGAVTAAVLSDLKTGLIPNLLTIPLWLIGLAVSLYLGGWAGLGAALGAGLLTAATTFQFSSPGGGDIKLALAVGAWTGLSGWLFYFLGASITRILLSLLVKFKTYGARSFIKGLVHEMKFCTVLAQQDKNFKVFQSAAGNAGYCGSVPVVPGALWIGGGVLSYSLSVFLGWGVF